MLGAGLVVVLLVRVIPTSFVGSKLQFFCGKNFTARPPTRLPSFSVYGTAPLSVLPQNLTASDASGVKANPPIDVRQYFHTPCSRDQWCTDLRCGILRPRISRAIFANFRRVSVFFLVYIFYTVEWNERRPSAETYIHLNDPRFIFIRFVFDHIENLFFICRVSFICLSLNCFVFSLIRVSFK